MLNKPVIWSLILGYFLSAGGLLGEERYGLITQFAEEMDVATVEAYFTQNPDSNNKVWAPLEQNLTRLALNIPRLGFERALEFQDGNSLFYLSDVSDLGIQIQKSNVFSIELNLGPDGSLMEVNRDLNYGFTLGVIAESSDQNQFGGVVEKSMAFSSVGTLSAKVSYLSNGAAHIIGEVVRLNSDEASELFSWLSFSTENDYKNLGFGSTWFDKKYDLDPTLVAQWDSKGWTGGLLFNKIQGELQFTLGFVDIDLKVEPTVYMSFSMSLKKSNKFSSKTSVRSANIKLQYLPQRSLKPFRHSELSRQWRENMDFTFQN